jgi:hypothetical protein
MKSVATLYLQSDAADYLEIEKSRQIGFYLTAME